MAIDNLKFAELLDKTLRYEGGFVDDPDDSGGATKYGITQATLAHYLKREITTETVRNLTKAKAFHIFRELYYEQPKINQLPELLQPIVFDAGVNMGTVKAIKRILQPVLSKMGTPIVCDGTIGDKTLMSAKAACNVYGHEVVVALVNARVHFYEDLVKSEPEKKKFLKGWLIRARSYL